MSGNATAGRALTRRVRLIAALAATLLGAIGWLAATPLAARASTNAPTVDQLVTAQGSDSASVSVTTSSSELLVAFVSANGPADAAQSATVSSGGTSWTDETSSSYMPDQYAAGYSGVFSTGSNLAAGSRTISVSLGDSGYNVWIAVVAFTGASGIEGYPGNPQSNSGQAGYPQVPLTTYSANNLLFAVGNDWENAIQPAPWPYPAQTIDSYWEDTASGDTSWLMHVNDPSPAGGENTTLALSDGNNDTFNMSGVVIDGT